MEKHSYQYETYLTVPEFAKEKKVSKVAIYKAIDRGTIKVIFIGRTQMPFISPAYLDSYQPKNRKQNVLHV